MKRNLLLFVLLLPAMLWAQDSIPPKNWKWTGLTALNLNQAGFSNWTAGGVNSIAFSALGKYTGDYTKNRFTWKNNLNLSYGMMKEENDPLTKSEDLIELISVAGTDLGEKKKWALTGYVSFRTQFAYGYDKDFDTIKISEFMAPAYLTLSPSLRYTPVDWFYLLLSPVTAKMTFVLDQELADQGSFGVQAAEYDTNGVKTQDGENMLLYLGPFAEAYMKKDLAKNLNFESRLNVMYTFLNREDPSGEKLDWYDMDASWQNFLNYKFAKFFSVSLFLHLVYYPGQPMIKFETQPDGIVTKDAAVNKKIQVKETIGIGLTYSFPNNK
jgi:hypothetical protein